MVAGGGLNNRATVEFVIENAPEAIERLAKLGVQFNLDGANGKGGDWHLTREGGHSHRRIVHVDDATGWAVQQALEPPTLRRPRGTSWVCKRCSSTTIRGWRAWCSPAW